MWTKCLRSVQFSSGSVQCIELQLFGRSRGKILGPLLQKSQLPSARGLSPGWSEGCACWLCLLTRPECGVASEWRKFSFKSLNKSSFTLVRLPGRVDWQFVQFSSGHGGKEPPFSSFSSVHELFWPWLCHFFETLFLEFLVVVWQNKWHFWNRETQLDKIGIFWKKILILKIWPHLTWTWPDLRPNVKMGVTIEFYVPNDP